MSRKSLLALELALLSILSTFPCYTDCAIGSVNDHIVIKSNDSVIQLSELTDITKFAQFSEPPASPCTVVSYATCNYLVPANDSVTFSLANDISFTTCPVGQLNTATITFQAAPSVPLFVWLSNATSSTTPVYMTGASQTITKAWFGAGATSWFGGGPWTTLNIQAIYPSPPPDTFYYPISCTIVYQ